MHVCTHTCIITYTCSCGFPAKLPPCVVRYPRAQSRKAETHLWAQGGQPVSPRAEAQKAAPHKEPPCLWPEHGKAEQHRALRNKRGHLRGRKPGALFPIFCCVPGSWELTAFAASPAAERVPDAPHAAPGATPCSASGHTRVGDAELHASGQKPSLLLQFHTKLGAFFLTLLSISGEKLFCV